MSEYGKTQELAMQIRSTYGGTNKECLELAAKIRANEIAAETLERLKSEEE